MFPLRAINFVKQFTTISAITSRKVSAFFQDRYVVIDASKTAVEKSPLHDKNDGELLKYPIVWLRDNCQCSNCFHKGSSSRVLDWCTFDVNVAPIEVIVCLSID